MLLCTYLCLHAWHYWVLWKEIKSPYTIELNSITFLIYHTCRFQILLGACFITLLTTHARLIIQSVFPFVWWLCPQWLDPKNHSNLWTYLGPSYSLENVATSCNKQTSFASCWNKSSSSINVASFSKEALTNVEKKLIKSRCK